MTFPEHIRCYLYFLCVQSFVAAAIINCLFFCGVWIKVCDTRTEYWQIIADAIACQERTEERKDICMKFLFDLLKLAFANSTFYSLVYEYNHVYELLYFVLHIVLSILLFLIDSVTRILEYFGIGKFVNTFWILLLCETVR